MTEIIVFILKIQEWFYFARQKLGKKKRVDIYNNFKLFSEFDKTLILIIVTDSSIILLSFFS